MRPGEKQVLKASMVRHAERTLRQEVALLHQYRAMKHGRPGWADLVHQQILTVRRARIQLEATETWWKLYSSCLVISSPKFGDHERDAFGTGAIEQHLNDARREEWERELRSPSP